MDSLFSVGVGSDPYFSKLTTTPLWTFCAKDSKHWLSVFKELTVYERPKQGKEREREKKKNKELCLRFIMNY